MWTLEEYNIGVCGEFGLYTYNQISVSSMEFCIFVIFSTDLRIRNTKKMRSLINTEKKYGENMEMVCKKYGEYRDSGPNFF